MSLNTFDPVEWNRYGYARNNPATFADPSGRVAGTWNPPMQNGRATFRGLGEYAMITLFVLGTAVGVYAVGVSTACIYRRVTSLFMALEKAAIPLFLLMMSRPQGEKCVIPVMVWAGDAVAFHIHDAQYYQGQPMLKTLDRNDRKVVDDRRTAATAKCLSPRPKESGWPAIPGSKRIGQECDEYPYPTTLQGGANASVMLVPGGSNGAHGGALKAFYNGGYTNRWGERLKDGELFATVILSWMDPPLGSSAPIP